MLKRGPGAIPPNKRSRKVKIDGECVRLAELASDPRYSFDVSPRLRRDQQPVIWRDNEKRCNDCSAFKPPGHFSTHNGRVDKLQTRCKKCHQIEQSVREINRSNEEDGIDHRVTADQVCAVIARANDHCEVCDAPAEYGGGERNAALDHSHETGRIRGILCNHCNLAEGNVAATGMASAEDWGRKMDAYLNTNS